MMVTIKQQLIADTPYKYGRNNKKLYITIHETANTSKGANAQAHANLQSNGNSRNASWHWQVDDKQAIQSFAHDFQLWHGGDGSGDGNRNSIGIEICVNSDGDYLKAVQNAIELTKKIMKDENIPVKNVVQHFTWSKKDCPRYLREGKRGITWDQFVKQLSETSETAEVKPPAPTPSKPNPTPQPSNKTYKVVTSVDGYVNANDAKSKKNKKTTVKTGTYYVFNKAQGMINVSAKQGVAGSWINPNENKVTAPSKPKPQPTPSKKYNSIVDYLVANKIDSSFTNRKKLADKHGIRNYTGTAAQNTQLLNILQGGGSASTAPSKPKLTISQMADKIINDKKAPTGHTERQKWLGVDKATYEKVRQEVNKSFK